MKSVLFQERLHFFRRGLPMQPLAKSTLALVLAALILVPALAQQTTPAAGQTPQTGGAQPGQAPQRGGVQPGQVPQRGGVQPGQVPQTGQSNMGLPAGINSPLFLNPQVRRELNV